ncbi:MAG: chitobiase/beta-hexosaminidase C-terminal domain-containing protein [Spirochaetales bacterium]|nr:chitobiase/beta-hexosaminidase C-terminal domain-containing protein [Spirochaetales bacterium]
MIRNIIKSIAFSAVFLSLCVLTSCTERYPYFIQIPEFIEWEPEDGSGGIMLSIVCEDENALIRYTTDGSEPSDRHGLIYEVPLYLYAQSVHIQAVAVRAGYDAGPVAEYYYEHEE